MLGLHSVDVKRARPWWPADLPRCCSACSGSGSGRQHWDP